MADVLNFTNPIELDIWLKEKPDEWARVIAVRAALRVLPLVGAIYKDDSVIREEQNRFNLFAYRACLISSAAQKYPTRKMYDSARAAAFATDVAIGAYAIIIGDTSRVASFAASFASARAANFAADAVAVTAGDLSHVVATAAVDAARAAVDAARAAADVARAAADARDMWKVISQDADWLNDQKGNSSEQVRKLVQNRLWPDGEPKWIMAERQYLTTTLLSQSDHHLVWIDWYNNVLDGKPFFGLSPAREKAFTLNIAQQENDFWEQEFAKVSKNISGWLDEAQLEDAAEVAQRQLDEVEVEPEKLSVPPIKPATVQPKWVGGKLVQSNEQMHASLENQVLTAFAQALRNEIASLATSTADANFDKRALTFLSDTAEMLPNSKPDSVLLFQLIMREAQLTDQIELIKDQWSETLSSRYCTLLRQLSDYLDRFSERRQFRRNILETDLEDVDLEIWQHDFAAFGYFLRSDQAKVVIDISIPDALDSIGLSNGNEEEFEPLPDSESNSAHIIKAADQIESVNNISRELVDAVGGDKAATLFEKGKSAYEEGMVDGYVEASREAGLEDAKKIAKAVNRGAVGASAGKSLWNRLANIVPKDFGWLKHDED